MSAVKAPPHIFRAYDIRGIFNKDISPSVFLSIGLALGALAEERGWHRCVVVGRDIRRTSDALAKALQAGLLAAGVDVADVGVAPFGVSAFAGFSLRKSVVAFVTASHLPPEWNGLKLYLGDGIAFSEAENEALRELVLSGKAEERSKGWSEVGASHALSSMREEYIEHLSSLFDCRDFKGRVLLDCGNGCMGLVALDVMRNAGVEHVDALFPNPDWRFPNRAPEPTAESIRALREEVLRKNADFGAAFDGDGDRVVFVDDCGRVLSAEHAAVVVAKDLLSRRKGDRNIVLANVECSLLLEAELEGMGAKVERIPVGHTFLTRLASQRKAIFGVESSGHFVIPEIFPFDDAMLMPLKIAEVLAKTGRKLSEIIDEMPKFYKRRVNLRCDDRIKFDVMRVLEKRLVSEFGEEKINLADGIRVDLRESSGGGAGEEEGGGWVLIRASNTEPLIRITSEAGSEEKMEEQLNAFVKRTKQVINTL
ncbi:MAG: hypothetical protein N2V74_06055 [Candidatus Methanospirare jalkutatii]|nr:MAG: hypothetical protein N2V74_06055 [Candidatus Methanospirare jalkutatii]